MNSIYESLYQKNGEASLFHINQAGFVLKNRKGELLGIDLYLSDCVERYDGFKRLAPKVLDPCQLQLDFIIATHWHLDHFDIDAMPWIMANRNCRLICADDCEGHVEALHLDKTRVTYIKPGDTVSCGDYIVHAVYCDHGDGAPKAVGVVVEMDGYKIYEAGDTCLRLDLAEEISKLGPFDIMIAPINGAFGNLNERDHVKLCAFHKPKLTIPCHFWTFAEQHGDPGVFMTEMGKELPDQKYLIMAPGEELKLDRE